MLSYDDTQDDISDFIRLSGANSEGKVVLQVDGDDALNGQNFHSLVTFADQGLDLDALISSGSLIV